MSEPTAPPPPPQYTPPPPSANPPGVSPNRSIMIVLSYLWLLALVPLLVEKDDREVQWHAKHGIVLMVAEIILWMAFFILHWIPFLGCALLIIQVALWFGILIVHILCIVKGVNGERFIIPGISQYADRF
jgi:uncharacterized membrane protein